MGRKKMVLVLISAAFGLFSLNPFVGVAQAQKVYELKASPENVHWGYFSADLKPVVRIDPGDIVIIEDIPRLDPPDMEKIGIPPEEMSESYRAVYREVTDRGPGPHIMVGPVYINGAEPGDVLEVRILEVDLAYSFGYSRLSSRGGTLPGEFERWERILRIDLQKKTTEAAEGVIIPLDHPFFGSMGVAPEPEAGRISTVPPGVYAGNMDNKDLGAGAILYIPVHTEGALFSAGDAHAVQGHGEVSINALETGLRGRFQFFVRKDMKLKWPRAETPTHWMVMGLHEDLDEAMKIAVRETIDFMVERFPHLSRNEAFMIASLAVDYHVTQNVDRTKGIHGMIPKDIFKD
ncbi:acetamidase/formamidase family protein [Acidobacteria bacterium AH-259-D05]|nr:acetamidase/formamidase family protein [Acidobacteria bacterium AH-259-D05]